MTKAYDCAVRLLARREHGMIELTKKLISKGYTAQESKEAILKCQMLDLQSDKRFAESICYTRVQQGYGPVRIMQELQAKSINKELITQALALYEEQWEQQALLVWQKKFKDLDFHLTSELQKQIRFLLYRGFPSEIAAKVVHKRNK
ncbi:recombination regulator RecX [Legionella sp. D16C41]|uniref:recombination regulator RecX n=1 Tax=Legionella sp. D16C41 TaxID=3402688 RepID=UPI003AF4D22A